MVKEGHVRENHSFHLFTPSIQASVLKKPIIKIWKEKDNMFITIRKWKRKGKNGKEGKGYILNRLEVLLGRETDSSVQLIHHSFTPNPDCRSKLHANQSIV